MNPLTPLFFLAFFIVALFSGDPVWRAQFVILQWWESFNPQVIRVMNVSIVGGNTLNDSILMNKIVTILFHAADEGRAITEKEGYYFDTLFFELVEKRCGIEKARQVYNIKD